MNKNKCYAGIDYFRFIAALLIITIHTSPLVSFSETGDFILTRVIARVAVPFFFMTSGFFMISRYTSGTDKLKGFIRNTLQIYGIAILIYIPINIYNGYFSGKDFLPNILKDIIFDGTLYHLWYLPAAALGGAIAWYLVKKADYTKAIAIAGGLYLIGLFGDSYYGIAETIPGIHSFYDLIFQVTDYTRNGIFYAPIFFVLGGYIADRPKELSPVQSVCGFAVSFGLMLTEALILHNYDLQRHDSMYLFLLPCMFFLFHALLYLRGKRSRFLRTSALIIYVIHPMVIVGVRLIAKLLHIQSLLVDNSMIHFLIVCMVSVAFGIAVTGIFNKFELKKGMHIPDTDRAWIEIDLNNLEHNAKELQKAMPPKCSLMAVVKAQAYGHGAFAVSAHLNKIGVRSFAVATIDEGIALRKYGIRGEILILGYTDVHRARDLKKYDLMQTVISFEYACALNKQNVSAKVHIKIDTGMHRLGIPFDNFSEVKQVFAMRNLNVCGIYSHLCCSDSLLPDDAAFTEEQIKRFYGLIDLLKQNNISVPKLHMQSSYGLLNYPDLQCDYARIGIALYGVLTTTDYNTAMKLDLRPVLALKTKVVHIQDVRKGESAGYSRAFTAERDSRIAILPIGYGDGFPRNLSCGKGYVQIKCQLAPIVGRICMDQLAVDVTDIENIAVGDTATLIGRNDIEKLSATIIAKNSDSISNELLCRMGARLPVIENNKQG